MSPENLSTKAVDNPVKKGAGSKMSCASLRIGQKLTSLNTVIKNNNLQDSWSADAAPGIVKIR